MAKKEDKFSLPMPRFKSNDDQQLSPKDKLTRSKTMVYSTLPFFSTLISRVRISVVPDDQTLSGTAQISDTGDMLISESFIKNLASDELVGLLCHEIMHPALNVFERMKKYPKVVMVVDDSGNARPIKLFNIAQDFFINLTLIEMFSEMQNKDKEGKGRTFNINLPAGGLYNPRFKGMSSEEIYTILDQEIEARGNKIQIDGYMEDVGEPTKVSSEGQPLDSHEQQRRARELEEFWNQTLIEAIQQSDRIKPRGHISDSIRKYVHELLFPRVHWTEVISKWIGEHGGSQIKTYMKPGRRSHALGITLKSSKPSDISDICVIMDTSGSMGGREQEIISEIIAISEDLNLSLRVVAIDCAIHDDVSDVSSPEDISFKGGGGSDLNPIFEKLDIERYTGVVIVFTDGYIGVPKTMPSTLKAVLWVLYKEHHDIQPAPWGEALLIDPDGFTHREEGAFKK